MTGEEFAKGIEAILGLKPYIQLALPVGYVAYVISRLGLTDKDRSVDTWFMSMVFALISAIVWRTSAIFFHWHWVVISSAIIVPLAIAIFWRKIGHKLVAHLLHILRIGNCTQFPTIWSEITQNTEVGKSQVTVYLKNGDALSCNYIYDFAQAPIRLLRTDKEGNVALYVTHERAAGEENFSPSKDEPRINNGPIQFRLTFIPKDEIHRVEFVINKTIS